MNMRTALNNRQLKQLKYASGTTGKLLLRDCGGFLNGSWCDFFAKSPDATIFHSTEYIRYGSIENGFGDMLLVEHQGNPCFALPVHWGGVLKITTGYSGVVFPESNTERQLRHFVEKFVEFVMLNTHLRIEIIQSGQSATALMPSRRNLISSYMHQALIQEKQGTYTRVVDLRPDQDTKLSMRSCLMNNFESKIRNQIKKAIDNDVRTISFDLRDKTDIDNFVDQYHLMHTETFLRTGETPHPKYHFINLIRSFLTMEGTCIGTIAIKDNTPIAGVISTRFREVCLYWSGCSTILGQKMNGNAAALLGAMEFSGNAGAKFFETGRFNRGLDGSKESAIERFKSQFGGEHLPVEYFVSLSVKSLSVKFLHRLVNFFSRLFPL